MDELNKIYIEPTNRCNLNCLICIRNSWNETYGEMAWPVYRKLINDLKDFPEAKTIAFAGLGEPLLHPQLPEMISFAHEQGLRTEITSNALLLTPAMARRLIDAGLNQFTVSIDGASEDVYENIRPGSSLEQIVKNVTYLRRLTEADAKPIRIGVVFVAMRRNIQELPHLKKIARRIKASFILLTNILPYTADLQDEILYRLGPRTNRISQAPSSPLWILPDMDFTEETMKPLASIFRSPSNLAFLDFPLNRRNNYCPFISAGSVSIGWHGGVSPCLPLLHSYTCFVRNREKRFLRCDFGNLAERPLNEIWANPGFSSFRELVRAFDFPPCTDCGGCELAETNEQDCFGNKFPVCGDCLWARGVLRCP
ncbi:MAG TPA: radical SAM protein [Smithellaceae bacterium]|nr:radical SAM protein [Smithellaceae bacterium]HRV25984.1 radical SAM protein [Smithellaceae bacterium]